MTANQFRSLSTCFAGVFVASMLLVASMPAPVL